MTDPSSLRTHSSGIAWPVVSRRRVLRLLAELHEDVLAHADDEDRAGVHPWRHSRASLQWRVGQVAKAVSRRA